MCGCRGGRRSVNNRGTTNRNIRSMSSRQQIQAQSQNQTQLGSLAAQGISKDRREIERKRRLAIERRNA